jgi:hypothetical protein
MSTKTIEWFKGFLGVGYRYHDVYMNVLLLFDNKKYAFNLWKKTIEWWADDEIKLRFVEDDKSYWFILYGGSEYKDDNTGFVKNVPMSENYHRFKCGYEKKAILRFGVYKERNTQNEYQQMFDLELLKRSKSIYDIKFIDYSALIVGSIEWKCIHGDETDTSKI